MFFLTQIFSVNGEEAKELGFYLGDLVIWFLGIGFLVVIKEPYSLY